MGPPGVPADEDVLPVRVSVELQIRMIQDSAKELQRLTKAIEKVKPPAIQLPEIRRVEQIAKDLQSMRNSLAHTSKPAQVQSATPAYRLDED